MCCVTNLDTFLIYTVCIYVALELVVGTQPQSLTNDQLSTLVYTHGHADMCPNVGHAGKKEWSYNYI